MFKPGFIVEYIYEWFAFPSRSRGRPSLPTVLNLPITDNCNSRCVMCYVWKNKSSGEIDAGQLGRFLRDPLYRRLRHVGISGGEPTLRSDLVEIVRAVCEAVPSLRSLSITSHGFHFKRWEQMLPQIAQICKDRKVAFTLNLSLDGTDQIHDAVRGIPGGYGRVLETFRTARRLGVRVEFQVTVSKQNVYNVGRVLQVAHGQLGAAIKFRLATRIRRLNNEEAMDAVSLDENENSFFADFLRSPELMRATPSPARRLFYKDLALRLIAHTPRRAPCHYQNEGLLLGAHGEMSHCSISEHSFGNAAQDSSARLFFSPESQDIRMRLLQDTCPGCVHDQSGAWPPAVLIREVLAESRPGKLARKAVRGLDILRRSLFWLSISLLVPFLKKAGKRSLEQSNLASALCIGMYGGEHVGDAAILGGVLLRAQKLLGIKEAFVASLRPDRTKRWLNSLSLPLRVNVISYAEASRMPARLDCLIQAGGPIMDLPEVLTKQLELAAKFSLRGKPFFIEGVGIGPLKNPYTRALARALMRMADRLTLRTQGDQDPILRDLDYQAGRDPAFDYLETRRVLSVPKTELGRISGLLPEGDGARVVGINLRPLWGKYLRDEDQEQQERLFLERFARGLEAVLNSSAQELKFVFFPMNSDQFGFSDLRIGYQLKDLLPKSFPLEVWETEPDVDAVLYLLRRLDACISMRFHSAIFSISQLVPTLGIDYSFLGPGKVSRLFGDLGFSESVQQISRFSPDWLATSLKEALN